MSEEKKIIATEVPEKDELNEEDLEKVNGGAIDSYLYFQHNSSVKTEKP